MKISKVIRELQEIQAKHGDIPCNVYLYKGIAPVRYVDVRDINESGGVVVKEVFIEGDKHQDL